MAPSADKSNQLPPKENALFKRVVRCYEHKQYKNGLKFAKQILSNPKFAEHGETLAMKGLILNCLGRREEAYDHVRRGLRNDLRSHVCWHVYGLLQRADKKYEEAIKAYRNALKWDKVYREYFLRNPTEQDNIQILRDLSLLQVQMRDIDGYRETRHTLFSLRPTQRASWIGFAMAHHLAGDFDMALKILDSFKNTQPTVKSYDYEQSELLLYENLVFREAGRFHEAMDHLTQNEAQICDKLAVLELKADLQCRLGNLVAAEKFFRALINRNPENSSYYVGLERCRTVKNCLPLDSDDNIHSRYCCFKQLAADYPRAMAPKRFPLNFVKGAFFHQLQSDYLKIALRKGAPALFLDMRGLYSDHEKVVITEQLLTLFLKNLLERSKFEDSEAAPLEAPSTILWVYYYLAQHHDFLHRPKLALDMINAARVHTPTLIELFVVEGKIFKHAGCPTAAARSLDEAQSLDTADRYLNSKAAKYLLRANRIKDGEVMAAKFTRVRKRFPSLLKEGMNVVDNLNEMQCMWFQTECARAFKRLQMYGEALKRCHEINRHFSDIIEDQFDFHTYCLRKMTLTSYWKLLKLEDTLRKHPFYYKAAKCALKIYLHLHDFPCEGSPLHDGKLSNDSVAIDLKKQKNKERKAALRAEHAKEAAKAVAERQQQHLKAKQKEPKDEPDPEAPILETLDPEKLVHVEKPLDEAVKFLRPLVELECKKPDVFILGFEIYLRKEKVLLMLQCIKKAAALDPDMPSLHLAKVKFLKYVKSNEKSFSEPLQHILREELAPPLFPSTNANDLNSERYAAEHDRSYAHRLAIAQAHFVLTAQQTAINKLIGPNCVPSNATWKDCRRVFKRLCDGTFGSVSQDVLDSYKEQCHARFPIASVFAPPVPISVGNHCPEETCNECAEDQSHDSGAVSQA